MKIGQLILAILSVFGFLETAAQSALTADTLLPAKTSSQYINAVSEKADKISNKMDEQTDRYLARLQKQEAKLQKKLSKIDSLAAHNIFSNAQSQYEQLRQDVKNKSAKLLRSTGQYMPWVDSAGNAMQFLANTKLGPVNPAQIKGALAKVKELEAQLKQAENVKEFIRQRKEYLKQQLQQYHLGSALKNYNKEAYYFTQQINDYKAILDDPEKIEQKALALLRKIPAFEKFMQEHGALAGLFNIPADYGQNMAGLQTIAQVQGMMQDRITSMGPNAAQTVQQNIAAAQAELSKLRNKFSNLGDAGDMPDFKPNEQHTRSFFRRLEYGVNTQTQKSNTFFPTTSDIALQVAYKLNEKNSIGIGASYKLGWGRDIRHISISSQGIGLRSFIDIKLKGSFYASGGMEYNYQKPFASLQQVKYLNDWQQSGLVGLSKIVSMKSKLFKKTRVQLLWDFLSYHQKPVGQPLKFRVGYGF